VPAFRYAPRRATSVSVMGDRERRVVSDLDTMYLNAEAIADIERLGISLVEGAPLRTSPEPTSRSLVLCGRRLV
jgi:hypothetical protein